MLGAAFAEDIRDLIERRDFATLRDALAEFEPADVAEIIADLPTEESCVVFRIMPRGFAADVFEHLDIADQEELLKGLGRETTAAILNEMSPDDRTALLEELPATLVERILNLLDDDERKVARTLLGYPEGSVGRLMTTEYVRIKPDMTVLQALDHLRLFGRDKETINNLYVTDGEGELLDDIRLRELVLAAHDAHIRDLMDGDFTALRATDPDEEAVKAFERYDRNALPVVDSRGRLVGIVTVDDILDVAQEAATEDIQRMGGTAALDDAYLETSTFDLVRKRVGWLVILFVGQMLTEVAMKGFEDKIAAASIIAIFIPLVISSGGNSGSQAATLVIRALAVGEVTLGDWWRVMRREIVCGLMLGGALAAIGFLRIYGWSLVNVGTYGEYPFLLACTVAAALVGIVLWGTLVGSMLPILLKRLGADPATSSTPFVATLVDVTGLVIYFTVCVLFLTGTLL